MAPIPSIGLIIFIKNPEKGKVKTRLAQEVGAERALRIYHALMNHTREVALQLKVKRYLFYSQFIPAEDAWPEASFDKRLQGGADLGERMYRAFDEVLKECERAVIIGSDCAELKPSILEEAFDRLNAHDFVLGPARDGGYYLLGMRRPQRELFEDMEWSTEEVARITLKRIRRQLGRTVFLLPTLSDIDYAKDWEAYGWDLEDS